MISFNIRCGNDHVFEAWFNSGGAYDEQAAAGDVACPVCGDNKVAKAPMAPRINAGRSRQQVTNRPGPEAIREFVQEVHRHVRENCEDVGSEFAEEARRIHYGEADEHGIYGEATDDEARELADEEIPFYRLPTLPRTDS